MIAPEAFSITPEWIAMCPGQDSWRQTFLESAEDRVGEDVFRHHQIWMEDNRVGCSADCLYYDIGPCAGVPTHCYATNHGHVPGAGRQITDAHISLIRESQRRASTMKGEYVPVGTECISEPFVGCFDIYYPRNAGFGLDMELMPYVRQLTWLPDGKMEVIPLFSFVYHDVGPLAVQGVYSADPWITNEANAINTWAEARAYLWGGLVTTFPLNANTVVGAQRQRFLQSLITARTSFAKEYLVYGRMQQPPSIPCEMVQLDHGLAEGGWLRNLRFKGTEKAKEAVGVEINNNSQQPTTETQSNKAESELSVEKWVAEMLSIGATPASNPKIDVPSVQCSAFTLENDRSGILLVNLKEHQQRIELPVDDILFGLASGEYELRQKTMDANAILKPTDNGRGVWIQLPPLEVVLVEAVRRSAVARPQ